METKISDSDFLGDTTALLRPGEQFDPASAYKLVLKELIGKI